MHRLAPAILPFLLLPAVALGQGPPREVGNFQKGVAIATALVPLLGILCGILLGVLCAVTPIIIAVRRGHPDVVPIALISILLTPVCCVGSVIGLIWSLKALPGHDA